MKTLGIIPARYNSSRFPGKPLANILGKSMIQRVYEQCEMCKDLNMIVVATDNKNIFSHVKSFGGNVIMTSKNHSTGTERCGEVVHEFKNEYDNIINIQGDQPYILPHQISTLVKSISEKKTKISTLAKQISDFQEYQNKSTVKITFNKHNIATSFTRESSIKKNEFLRYNIYKHIGVYAMKLDVINKIICLKEDPMEKNQNLEQIRWMKNDYQITVKVTQKDSISVDTLEDIKKIERLHLKNS